MRIIHLGDGSSPHLQRIASEIAARGHKCIIITRSDKCPNTPINGVEVKTFEHDINFISKIRVIRKLIRESNVDVVHSHFTNYGGYMGALSGFHPHINSAWGDDVWLVPDQSRIHRMLVRATLISADLILPVAKHLEDKCRALTNSHCKTEVWHWGTDTDHFTPRTDASTQFRHRIGVSDNEKLVYSPRLLWSDYNQDYLFNAWKAVTAAIPEARLLVKRDGKQPEYECTLRSIAKSCDIEKSLIWIDQLSYEEFAISLSAADLIVSLPTTEGTPMTVLEAMACGTIILSAESTGLSDWIKEGETGFITKLEVNSISNQIVNILKLPQETRQRICSLSRELVVNKANQKKCYDRLESIYAGLAKRIKPKFSF